MLHHQLFGNQYPVHACPVPWRTYQHIASPILTCDLVNIKTFPVCQPLMLIPERFDLSLRQQGSSERVDGLRTVFISEDLRIQPVMNQSAKLVLNWAKKQSESLFSIVIFQWADVV